MTEWEYKEDSWTNPIMPNLRNLSKDPKSGDKNLHYANLNLECGIPQGFFLGKDGYPEFTEFKLDGLKREEFHSFDRHGRKSSPNPYANVLPLKEAKKQIADWESKIIPDFTTWLGHHSKEGWEIFKISRSFGDSRQSTWCVFRRKI